MECLRCNKEIPDTGARFCPFCGAIVPQENHEQEFSYFSQPVYQKDKTKTEKRRHSRRKPAAGKGTLAAVIIGALLVILLLLLLLFLLPKIRKGSVSKEIVGQWKYDESLHTEMIFYKDGTFEAADVTHSYAAHYRVEKNGDLVIINDEEGGEETVVRRTKYAEVASGNEECYYLENDTLIFSQKTFRRIAE